MKVLLSRKFSLSALIFILTVLPFSSAFAGTPGILVYGPVTAAIPTLSGTMLVVLSLLLFAIAMRVARQKNVKGGKLFLTLIGTGALISGIGGIKLVSDVVAGVTMPTIHPLTNALGDTAPIDLMSINKYNNDTGVTIEIKQINLPGDCPGTESGVEGVVLCQVGQRHNPGGMCAIKCLPEEYDTETDLF